MIAKKIFEEVSSKLNETIENSPAKDMEKNIKAMLGGVFNRMDLVTREEFDVQQQILIKTRTKLTDLEVHLAKLEETLASIQATSTAKTNENEAVPEQKE